MNEVLTTIIYITLGAIIMWGIIIRYRTLNTGGFVTNAQVSVFLFASFAAGMLLIDYNYAEHIVLRVVWNGPILLLALVAPVFFPFCLRLMQGYYFRSAWQWSWWYPIAAFALAFTITFLDEIEAHEPIVIFHFMSLSILFGLIHSLLGPVISGFNLAVILSSILSANAFPVSVSNVFDVIALTGLHSQSIQWIVLICSTILGLHGTFDSHWLRNKFEWAKEKVI